MSVLCGLSCGLISSLKVLMLFVDKTSLELVYLKQQKKNFKKKSCLLKKNFMWEKKKNYSRISFVLAWEALMSLFYRGLLDVFVFSKMWSVLFFLLKSENYLVPNSKGTSFLELRVFPVRSDLITWYFIMCFV